MARQRPCVGVVAATGISPYQQRDGLPAIEIGDWLGRRRRRRHGRAKKTEQERQVATRHRVSPADGVSQEDVRFLTAALVPLARNAVNDYLGRIATIEARPMTAMPTTMSLLD